MSTTPTGIPIIFCNYCGRTHPENRNHCRTCYTPSLFIDPDNQCRTCKEEQP